MKRFKNFKNFKAFDIAVAATVSAVVINSIFAFCVLILHTAPDFYALVTIGIVLILNIICLIMVIIMRRTFNNRLKTKIAEPVLKIKTEIDMLVQSDFAMPEIVEGSVEMEGVYSSLKSIGDIIRDYKADLKKNEANKLIYISGLMHDLATPITRINGFASMISDGIVEDSDEIRKFAELIIQNTEDINIMLKNLAEIEKYNDTVIHNQMLPIDISSLLSRYTKDLKLELEMKNAQLEYVDNCVGPAVCMLDVKSCKRVLMNIINNSLKYRNPDTGCKIVFTLATENNNVILSVADNGIGFKSDSCEKMFELFYRGDDSRHNFNDGNGLGLYISREIIESHSGKIYAENNGNGLTVYISLPLTSAVPVEWY